MYSYRRNSCFPINGTTPLYLRKNAVNPPELSCSVDPFQNKAVSVMMEPKERYQLRNLDGIQIDGMGRRIVSGAKLCAPSCPAVNEYLKQLNISACKTSECFPSINKSIGICTTQQNDSEKTNQGNDSCFLVKSRTTSLHTKTGNYLPLSQVCARRANLSVSRTETLNIPLLQATNASISQLVKSRGNPAQSRETEFNPHPYDDNTSRSIYLNSCGSHLRSLQCWNSNARPLATDEKKTSQENVKEKRKKLRKRKRKKSKKGSGLSFLKNIETYDLHKHSMPEKQHVAIREHSEILGLQKHLVREKQHMAVRENSKTLGLQRNSVPETQKIASRVHRQTLSLQKHPLPERQKVTFLEDCLRETSVPETKKVAFWEDREVLGLRKTLVPETQQTALQKYLKTLDLQKHLVPEKQKVAFLDDQEILGPQKTSAQETQETALLKYRKTLDLQKHSVPETQQVTLHEKRKTFGLQKHSVPETQQVSFRENRQTPRLQKHRARENQQMAVTEYRETLKQYTVPETQQKLLNALTALSLELDPCPPEKLRRRKSRRKLKFSRVLDNCRKRKPPKLSDLCGWISRSQILGTRHKVTSPCPAKGPKRRNRRWRRKKRLQVIGQAVSPVLEAPSEPA